MGISTLQRSIGDNWELIATNTPTTATQSTFSSIAENYSKLLVTVDVTHSSSTTPIVLTFNNSTSGYLCFGSYGFVNSTVGIFNTSSTSGHILASANGSYGGTASLGFAIIESAQTTGGKIIKSWGQAGGGGYPMSLEVNGFWAGTAAITEIDIDGPSMTGTIKLYGVRS